MPTSLCLLRLRDPEILKHMTPAQERTKETHFLRLQRDVHAGTVLLAGPCTDGAFGIVVYEAASPEAAQVYVDADPAVETGLMHAEIHPFRVSLMRGRADPLSDREPRA